MAAGREFGVTLLVDVTKMIVTLSTSIIGGIFAVFTFKAPALDKLRLQCESGIGQQLHAACGTISATVLPAKLAIVFAGVAVLFATVFLFYVAERNMKLREWPWLVTGTLVGAYWLPFLLSVAFAAIYSFSLV